MAIVYINKVGIIHNMWWFGQGVTPWFGYNNIIMPNYLLYPAKLLIAAMNFIDCCECQCEPSSVFQSIQVKHRP